MRRTILLAGVLPFVSAFLGGSLAFSLAAAPQATAQSSQPQEVRASAFILVGADGTVLGSLSPTPAGAGHMHLYDAAGTNRLVMSAVGSVTAYDQDGTTPVFRAGRTFGGAPLNGVQLGPDGSISMLPRSP